MQKTLGGTDIDRASSAIQLAGGNFIVVGESLSNDGDVSGSIGGKDVWLVKLDAGGNILWQKCLGGSSIDPLRRFKSAANRAQNSPTN